MADSNVKIAVLDEGYNKKFYELSPRTNLKKLLDVYRGLLCPECTKPELLDFWFDTTQIQNGHTASDLNITDGDILDVRINTPCTRGACPLPEGQTLPNIHYLNHAAPPASSPTQTAPTIALPIPPNGTEPADPARFASVVRESQPVLTNSERITITVKDQVNASLTLRIKKSTPFRKVLEAYAKSADRAAWTLRMYLDGQRLGLDDTPAKVEMEEGDLVDVFTEQTGGGNMAW